MNDYVWEHPHRLVAKKVDDKDITAIELLDNLYNGIIFSYGKVSFDEDEANDQLNLHFEYEVHRDNDTEYNKEDFEKYLGDFLQELIHYQLAQNEIVYTGGTDEQNREDNIIELDPR